LFDICQAFGWLLKLFHPACLSLGSDAEGKSFCWLGLASRL
jgi:hypothetical protein